MRKLEEMTDEQLALAYVEGDNRAFDLLLSRNEVKLFGYIMFVVHDQEKANDVFQETFVKVVTKLQQRQYVPNGKFLAWCMRIAHNVMMDMYRDNRLQNIVETPDDNDMSKIRDEYVVFDNAENTIVRGQVMSDVKKMGMDLRTDGKRLCGYQDRHEWQYEHRKVRAMTFPRSEVSKSDLSSSEDFFLVSVKVPPGLIRDTPMPSDLHSSLRL